MIHTKRYLAACGANYYADCNFGDIVGHFDTPNEAIEACKASGRAKEASGGWLAVYDLLTERVVATQYTRHRDGDWLGEEVSE